MQICPRHQVAVVQWSSDKNMIGGGGGGDLIPTGRVISGCNDEVTVITGWLRGGVSLYQRNSGELVWVQSYYTHIRVYPDRSRVHKGAQVLVSQLVGQSVCQPSVGRLVSQSASRSVNHQSVGWSVSRSVGQVTNCNSQILSYIFQFYNEDWNSLFIGSKTAVDQFFTIVDCHWRTPWPQSWCRAVWLPSEDADDVLLMAAWLWRGKTNPGERIVGLQDGVPLMC